MTAVVMTLYAVNIYGQKRNVSSDLVKYPSPDGSLVAVVTSHRQPKATAESEIEVRTPSGKLLAHQSYTSEDGEHGYGVSKAQWTPNSKYFVFSLESSGGHQAWRSPVQYFSRVDDSFLSLDDALKNAVMSPQFVIAAPDKVTVDLYFGNKSVTASLSALKAAR